MVYRVRCHAMKCPDPDAHDFYGTEGIIIASRKKMSNPDNTILYYPDDGVPVYCVCLYVRDFDILREE